MSFFSRSLRAASNARSRSKFSKYEEKSPLCIYFSHKYSKRARHTAAPVFYIPIHLETILLLLLEPVARVAIHDGKYDNTDGNDRKSDW